MQAAPKMQNHRIACMEGRVRTTKSVVQTVMMAIITVTVAVFGQLVLGQGAVEPALGELHAPQGHKREFWGLRNLR